MRGGGNIAETASIGSPVPSQDWDTPNAEVRGLLYLP